MGLKMRTNKPTWTNKTLVKMEAKGDLLFNHPIQRKGGQWDALQQSLLIHSIIGGYPIPPVLVLRGTDEEVEEGKKAKPRYYVLDGKQRTTTVLNYMSGKKDADEKYPERAFKLHEDTPDVIVNDETYELAGKYFEELEEDIMAELNGNSFQITSLEEATDEEIEELFERWNNGTPLTKQQKTRGLMGVTKAMEFDKLVNHPFIQEGTALTPLQLRRSADEGAVIQALMLLSGKPFESFVADNMLKFARELRSEETTELFKELTETMDYIVNSGVGKSSLFKPLHLPMVMMVAKKAKDEKVSPIVFTAWVEDFKDAINPKKKAKTLLATDFGYKNEFTGAGSVKGNKVRGRHETMLKHFGEFVEKYEIPAVEEVEDKQEDAVENTDTNETVTNETVEDAQSVENAHAELEEEMKKVHEELENAMKG